VQLDSGRADADCGDAYETQSALMGCLEPLRETPRDPEVVGRSCNSFQLFEQSAAGRSLSELATSTGIQLDREFQAIAFLENLPSRLNPMHSNAIAAAQNYDVSDVASIGLPRVGFKQLSTSWRRARPAVALNL